jgi:hypothetical protein
MKIYGMSLIWAGTISLDSTFNARKKTIVNNLSGGPKTYGSGSVPELELSNLLADAPVLESGLLQPPPRLLQPTQHSVRRLLDPGLFQPAIDQWYFNT